MIFLDYFVFRARQIQRKVKLPQWNQPRSQAAQANVVGGNESEDSTGEEPEVMCHQFYLYIRCYSMVAVVTAVCSVLFN